MVETLKSLQEAAKLEDSSWRDRRKAQNDMKKLSSPSHKILKDNIGKLGKLIADLRDQAKEESQLFLSSNAFQISELLNDASERNNNATPSRTFYALACFPGPSPTVVRRRPRGSAALDLSWFRLESIPYEPHLKDDVMEDVRVLAEVLNHAQRDNGILSIAGFRDGFESGNQPATSFQLVFSLPVLLAQGQPPSTVQKALVDPTTEKPSLNEPGHLSTASDCCPTNSRPGPTAQEHPTTQYLAPCRSRCLGVDNASSMNASMPIFPIKAVLVGWENARDTVHASLWGRATILER